MAASWWCRSFSMENKGANGAGTGFFSLLGLLFIGLKLANVIDWPWWLVLAPIWGPFVLVLMILVLFEGVDAISHFFND